MGVINLNGVSFNASWVAKFKSSEALAKSMPHIWANLANRDELFVKVYELVKPPKKDKDTAKKK